MAARLSTLPTIASSTFRHSSSASLFVTPPPPSPKNHASIVSAFLPRFVSPSPPQSLSICGKRLAPQQDLLNFGRFKLVPSPGTPRLTGFCVMASITGASPPQATPVEKEVDEETKFWERLQHHQKAAAILSAVEEARTVVDRSLSAILSTISQQYEGFPYGSFIDIASDEDGHPLLAISNLAPHTKDLEATSKCSLLIMKDLGDRSDVIITILGEATFVSEQDQRSVRDCFLKKHPEAFWVDFGDFRFVRIEPREVRYMTGIATPFNRSSAFPGEEFKRAKVDPMAQFSTPISSHMNKDHAEETRLIVERVIGIKVDHAKILDLDRLGLNVQVGRKGNLIKLRVPFPRAAEDRKDVKTLIVQMLDSARVSSEK